MFSASDCWVLFSVGFDRKGADLQKIITSGDRINHAIFSWDELENGINTLLHNGFLRRDENVFERVDPLFAREKAHVRRREDERVLGREDERVLGREDPHFAQKNDRFFATPKARQFYKKDRKFFEGSIEELFRFSELLAALPCEDSTVKEYELREEDYQAAVRAYTKN